jgi:Tfp pilus assembly protein PilO
MNARMKKICFILVILLVVVAAGCIGFWLLIRHTVQEIYVAEAAAEEAKVNFQEENALKNLLGEVGPDIQKLNTRIIAPEGTVAFITYIESLARSAGVGITINSVDVKDSTKELEKEKFELLMLTIHAEGAWKEIYTFISMVESLPYKVVIESVGLSQDAFTQSNASGTAQTVSHTWKGNIMIKVLKRK